MLIVFGGLPGSGKTTLSRSLAAELHAAHLRVDLIEAAPDLPGFTVPTWQEVLDRE